MHFPIFANGFSVIAFLFLLSTAVSESNMDAYNIQSFSAEDFTLTTSQLSSISTSNFLVENDVDVNTNFAGQGDRFNDIFQKNIQYDWNAMMKESELGNQEESTFLVCLDSTSRKGMEKFEKVMKKYHYNYILFSRSESSICYIVNDGVDTIHYLRWIVPQIDSIIPFISLIKEAPEFSSSIELAYNVSADSKENDAFSCENGYTLTLSPVLTESTSLEKLSFSKIATALVDGSYMLELENSFLYSSDVENKIEIIGEDEDSNSMNEVGNILDTRLKSIERIRANPDICDFSNIVFGESRSSIAIQTSPGVADISMENICNLTSETNISIENNRDCLITLLSYLTNRKEIIYVEPNAKFNVAEFRDNLRASNSNHRKLGPIQSPDYVASLLMGSKTARSWAFRRAGLTGDGVTIGITDTGVKRESCYFRDANGDNINADGADFDSSANFHA